MNGYEEDVPDTPLPKCIESPTKIRPMEDDEDEVAHYSFLPMIQNKNNFISKPIPRVSPRGYKSIKISNLEPMDLTN